MIRNVVTFAVTLLYTNVLWEDKDGTLNEKITMYKDRIFLQRYLFLTKDRIKTYALL